MGLIEKSEHNFEIARQLEKKSDYNVCTNRLYYSFYQLLVLKLDRKAKINLGGRGSHEESFQKYLKEVYFKGSSLSSDEVEAETLMYLSRFTNMKAFRLKADYKNDDINKDDFNKFKFLYSEMTALLEES